MVVIPMILPLLAWGAIVVLGGGLIGGAIGALSNDPKKYKLGILGMQAAGKTRFLNFIQNKLFIEGTTSRITYEEFRYKLMSGKEITICSGIDLGGESLYRKEYNKIISDSDLILFFLDIDKYIKNPFENEEFYQRGCNSRLEHIYSENKEKKTIKIIATHRDKCKLSDGEMKRTFEILIQNKSYKKILNDVKYINLLNSTEIKSLINAIFDSK